MTIRILDSNLVNQIAAGEVLERPSAAIKELVENAIDAKATRIDIAIEEGGKSFLSVTDDGFGMDKSELALAIERHATSKIPDNDLSNINSFGFRGEALPSIGAVARLGNSYGWLVKDIAAKVGDKGLFEVIDAVPIQAESAGEKLSPWPHFKSIVKDIEHYHPSKKYDTIVCYFLLHEMPDKKKKRVIKNIASMLALNGRAVFIDYGTASKYHPLKYLLRAYNNIFEPFADSLFKTGIKDFTDDDNLHFVTKTFFGGLYQKTIMTIKKG